MQKQKGLARLALAKGISTLVGIIVIVVVAIVAFGGVFAYQYFTKTAGLPVQSQQATEGWKTYTNTQYGFSFQYPPNLEVASGTHHGGGIQNPGYVQFAISDPNNRGGELNIDLLALFSVEPTNFKNNNDYLTNRKSGIENINISNKWSATLKNFFNMGQAVFVSDSSGTLPEEVHIVRNSLLFTFDDYNSSNYTSQTRKIINTFKFTTPNLITCDPSWPICITSINPSFGPVGTVVTLTGNNFTSGGVTNLGISESGNHGLSPDFVSPSQIRFNIPADIPSGPHNVSVFVSAMGSPTSNLVVFTVTTSK